MNLIGLFILLQRRTTVHDPHFKLYQNDSTISESLFKQDLVKKHEFYQCIYPILDDLYIPDKSYHDPHPPYFSIIDDHYGYQEDDPMTPERYEFETTEAYYRIRQYKKELAMLCNETEKNMAMRNHDPYLFGY